MLQVRHAAVAVALALAGAAGAEKPWLPQTSRPLAPETGKAPAAAEPASCGAEFGVLLGRGLGQLAEGRYQESVATLGRAIELCPACVEARLARARALLAIGYLSWQPGLVRRALADARAAVELNPRHGEGRQLWRLLDELWRRIQWAAGSRQGKPAGEDRAGGKERAPSAVR